MPARRRRSIRERGLLFVSIAALAAALALPSAAMAGRLVVTGHDADFHCSGGSQCHYVQIAVSYVRAGAPDPTKPVLVLDKGSNAMDKALDNAFPPAGSVPRTVVDPTSPAFASTAITTANFSAILVASDSTCGGCDLNSSSSTADSDAINARKADIEKFFNAGGGIFAAAGASHADGDAGNGADVYYNFVPIPVGGVAVAPPFTLTDVGKALGFEDSTNGIGTNDDINCCPTHNSFNLPASGSALRVAERDSKDLAETLVADGTISGGTIVKPGAGKPPKAGDVIKLPSSRRCVSRRRFRIRIRRPGGIKIEQAIVFVNGKRVRVVRGKRLRAPVDLRGLPKGQFRVAITVITSTGRVLRGSRKYRTCTKKRRGTRPPRL